MEFEGLEAEIYQFIRQHIKEHTHPPTLREIAVHCFLSVSNVLRYLDRLEMRGYIVREPGRARGITLTGKAPRL